MCLFKIYFEIFTAFYKEWDYPENCYLTRYRLHFFLRSRCSHFSTFQHFINFVITLDISHNREKLDELISFIKISFIPSRKGLDTTILIQINSSRVTTRIFKVILILRSSAHCGVGSKVGNGNK